MKLLDGKLLSNKIKDEVKACAEEYHQTPILAIISIGDNLSNEVYIKQKREACEYTGISLLHIRYDDNTPEKKIINKIKSLNKDKSINGIIVELPIPDSYNKNNIINSIDPIKDVDGLTNISQGKLFNNEDAFIPCTPKGIIELLDYYKVNLEGKHVVIVGRSNLVSKPLMIECLRRNATVTMCHSKTKKLSDFTSLADILIVCTGKKYLINKTMIKKDVIIIDVGITKEDGKVYGDVNPDVESLASYLSPVPGGVGPMTVCMLLKNLMLAYKKQNEEEKGI